MRTHLLLAAGVAVLGAAYVAAQGEGRFAVRSELVVLHAAVTDEGGRFVGGLPPDAFRVLDEGRPQVVSIFADEEAPATVGLLIDVSGSMLKNRDRMIAAITTFAEASHPDDEFLPVVFNERVTAALPSERRFTDDPSELRDALTGRLDARGRTAFHDALAEALDGIGHGRHERRVLIVLSDGGDNASRLTFDQVLRKVQASDVVIYTIALLDPLSHDGNPKALRRLAEATGGLAFHPRRASAVGDVFASIAADIRSRYTLAYVPTDVGTDARFRRIRVTAHAPGRSRLEVRTRTGYMTGAPSVGNRFEAPR